MSWRMGRLATFATVVGIIIVLAGVLQIYQTAENAHKAICALRAERIRGVQETRRFLAKHPNGVTLDVKHHDRISRADLLRSLNTQKETVRAFRFADC